ncbi:MAG: hypothetical protein J1D89_07430 [Agathobacter sp.]|nr:hypothetical protein [Agathobacter sp.]
MSTVGQTGGIANNYDSTYTSSAQKAAETDKTSGASRNYGNTIGDVKLSDKAAKYYETLKNKFSNMDFVLVSNDQVEGAEQKAAKYAKTGRTLVLIDADKIEKMAEDENYRKKYEGIIGNANAQLQSMQEQLASGTMQNVKTFGIKVDDHGNASYFAVIDKSLAQQRERIEKKAEDKKAEEKAAKAEEAKEAKKPGKTNGEDLETISASSVEELIRRLNNSYFSSMSDNVFTDQELQVGQQFDFRL